jgi:DNA-binding transcriptional MerR regulator
MNAAKKKAGRVKRHALTAASHTVDSPELGGPTLTVGQIVEQLGRIAPIPAAAMNERIRHWTREGLLLPLDRHHAGTGRHRRYSADASYEAATLNAFAEAGIPLASRPYILTALSQARAALQQWHRARSAGYKPPILFLVISQDVARIGGEPITSIHEGIVKYDPIAEITIVVNLSQLFARVRKARVEYRDHGQNAGSE